VKTSLAAAEQKIAGLISQLAAETAKAQVLMLQITTHACAQPHAAAAAVHDDWWNTLKFSVLPLHFLCIATSQRRCMLGRCQHVCMLRMGPRVIPVGCDACGRANAFSAIRWRRKCSSAPRQRRRSCPGQQQRPQCSERPRRRQRQPPRQPSSLPRCPNQCIFVPLSALTVQPSSTAALDGRRQPLEVTSADRPVAPAVWWTHDLLRGPCHLLVRYVLA